MSKSCDVIIAGGGPIGLYLAGRLLQKGIRCKVLEKRPAIDIHSKSLGIHPVSLELFRDAGIVARFLEQGLHIKKGIAFLNRDKVGEIRFDHCPEPFTFVIALPQWKTETILESWVLSLDKNAILRGADISDVSENHHTVTATCRRNGEKETISARFLVGCDGKSSTIRSFAAIPFEGKIYPDTYIMGDFEDNTSFGADAAVYLHRRGLVESFPLPGNQRRWVVKTDQFVAGPQPNILAGLVQDRLGHSLDGVDHMMVSSFGVQHFLAASFHKGRILLAGDAAHVVSPIGGQGMNLGWLGAEQCAGVLENALEQPDQRTILFERYSKFQRNIARQAARRAEVNMWLGRKRRSELTVWLLLTLMVRTPMARLLARVFTMRGLGTWPV